MANFAIPIDPQQDLGGAVSYPIKWLIEESAQTFLYGTPVQIASGDGGVKAWDGTTVAQGVCGIANQAGANLGTTGKGAPTGLTPVLGPGSVIGSYSGNPFQSAGTITPPGVPTNDGRTSFYVAGPTTVFSAAIGNNTNAIATANTQVGQIYGMTKDSNNFWYVDTNKSNLVIVTQLDPRDPIGTVGGRVWFTFINSAVQLFA